MSLFFYDLETSGLDPRWQRIMQFAGRRVNDNLEPIGEPVDLLVKLTDDVLPDPGAVLVTGITPQATIENGVSEAEFLKILHEKVFLPGTTMLGFNSLRFDDEFIRYTLFRNFYDPYEREYADNMDRWDILDLTRMMRALRPDGLEWPLGEDGKPTNRLEALAAANGIEHSGAHTALADVDATIELARLMRQAQPKLYEHLYKLRAKKEAKKLLEIGSQPVVHTSGRYSSDYLKTTVVVPVAPHPTNQNAVLVYDLRVSPAKFSEMDSKQLARLAFTPARELKEGEVRLPVKAVHINRSPALAPLAVLDDASQERIKLTMAQIKQHHKELQELKGFDQRLIDAWESNEMPEPPQDAEGQLYTGGFINDKDKKQLEKLRQLTPDQLETSAPTFDDERLQAMLLGYRARNYPETLSSDERIAWEQYRAQRLRDANRGLSFEKYQNQLAKMAEEFKNDKQKMFLLEELHLYAESILPFENETLV